MRIKRILALIAFLLIMGVILSYAKVKIEADKVIKISVLHYDDKRPVKTLVLSKTEAYELFTALKLVFEDRQQGGGTR